MRLRWCHGELLVAVINGDVGWSAAAAQGQRVAIWIGGGKHDLAIGAVFFHGECEWRANRTSTRPGADIWIRVDAQSWRLTQVVDRDGKRSSRREAAIADLDAY